MGSHVGRTGRHALKAAPQRCSLLGVITFSWLSARFERKRFAPVFARCVGVAQRRHDGWLLLRRCGAPFYSSITTW